MMKLVFIILVGFGMSFADISNEYALSGINVPQKECSCNKSRQIQHEQFSNYTRRPFSCPTIWNDQNQSVNDFNPERICVSNGHEKIKFETKAKSPRKTIKVSRPIPTCPRYIVASYNKEGVGHRHGAVIFTLNLAIEFGFTLVLDKHLMLGGAHGRYPEFREMLSLHGVKYDYELNRSRLQAYRVTSREQFVQTYFSKLRQTCNIIVYANLGSGGSCHTFSYQTWCFLTWPGAYERARANLSPRYPPLDPATLVLFEAAERRNALTVAWHLRCGDVTLSRDADFFRNLRALISSSGFDFQDYIFWKHCDSKFRFILDALPSAIIIDTHEPIAMNHMKGADVLVHTGSSFAVSAAIAAPNPQLFFQSRPKEKKDSARKTYSVKNAVNIANDGSLEAAQPFAFAGSEGLGGSINWTERYAPHVHRILQALHLKKLARMSRRSGPSRNRRLNLDEKAAVALLRHVYDYKVLSGALSGPDPAELDLWTHNAALAQQLLPTWTVVIYYNGSLAHNLCRLRERSNVQLVEMSGAAFSPESWQYLPLFDNVSQAVVFLGQPAIALTPCFAEAITEWANGCGGEDEFLHFKNCICRRLPECVWGAMKGAMGAAREALATSIRVEPGHAPDEKEELLLQQIMRRHVP